MRREHSPAQNTWTRILSDTAFMIEEFSMILNGKPPAKAECLSTNSEHPSGGLPRRDFLTKSCMSLAYAAALPYGRANVSPPKTEFVEVSTKYGRLRGIKSEGLATFKGIPYAGSVAGAGRFKAAPPLRPWTGVRDALQLGAPSLQPGGQRRNEPPSSEDCLFLNVWTPAADGRKRAVMFYNHGGGFTVGSGGTAYRKEFY